MSSNAIKEKSLLNYHIQYRRISIFLLISITLVSSSLYVLPVAYSQELSFIPIFKLTGTGTPGTQLEHSRLLSGPEGIAVDPSSGNVYVADTANHRILVFYSNNDTFISEWGKFGRGNGTFACPEGIAVDPSSGNVYVADRGNNRIQVVSINNGTFISEWG